MSEKERDEFADQAILYMYDNEKEGVVIKHKNLFSLLNIPFEYHAPVLNKLTRSTKRYVESKPGINVEIWLSAEGKQYAANLKSKKELVLKHQQIELYKFNALTTLKQHGIGVEAVWKSIAQEAGIPDSYSDDIKNILYDEGLMVKTKVAQGMGDLVRGQSRIAGYLLSLPKPISPVSVTDNSNTHQINIGGNVQNSNLSQLSDLRDTSPVLYSAQNMITDDKKTNQTEGSLMKFWKLISENKLISTILSALILSIIYYFLFGKKP